MSAAEEVNWAGEAAQAAWRVIGYDRSYSEGERRAGFNTGARWQRNQLRTDEAVERVAESIWITDPAPDTENETWSEQDNDMKNDYRKAARHAIGALLGEDPRP